MSQNDDLALAVIGAALIASRAVDIHDYDRQLLNRIIEAGGNPEQLLQVPVLGQLRTLAHAIHQVLDAPAAAGMVPIHTKGLMAELQKCAHPHCECRVAMDGPHWPHCSEHCKEAAYMTELRCDCQHSQCRQPNAVAGGD
jgi:hypothetical protein